MKCGGPFEFQAEMASEPLTVNQVFPLADVGMELEETLFHTLFMSWIEDAPPLFLPRSEAIDVQRRRRAVREKQDRHIW